jgi:hypothetical protein
MTLMTRSATLLIGAAMVLNAQPARAQLGYRRRTIPGSLHASIPIDDTLTVEAGGAYLAGGLRFRF